LGRLHTFPSEWRMAPGLICSSAAYSPVFDQVVVLAYVHIEHTTPGAEWQPGATRATVAKPFAISVRRQPEESSGPARPTLHNAE